MGVSGVTFATEEHLVNVLEAWKKAAVLAACLPPVYSIPVKVEVSKAVCAVLTINTRTERLVVFISIHLEAADVSQFYSTY